MRWLLSIILTCSACFGFYRSDINRDGITNLLDFQYLASEWLLESKEYMANNYLTFNGTDQYITVPHNAVFNFGTGDFSISFWATKNNTSSSVLCSKSTIYGEGFQIETKANGDIFMICGIAGENNYFAITSQNYNHSSVFDLITFTVDRGNLLSLYINGVLNNSVDISGVNLFDIDNVSDVYFGCQEGNDSFLNGSLDDIRFYNKALSSAEIAAIYNNGYGRKLDVNALPHGLVWGSNCDTGSGTTLVDILSNANGTLTSSDMWAEGGVPFDFGNYTAPEFIVSFNPFISKFGEGITYYKADGTVRAIYGIIDRNPISRIEAGRTPAITVVVANDETDGIDSSEIDTGGDKIGLAVRIGQDAQQRGIVGINWSDDEMMELEVR